MGKPIPARYVGEHEIMLSHHNGPYLNGDGKPLTDLVLRQGGSIHMNEDEVIGYTMLLDPRRDKEPVYLGPGRVILKEDQGKSNAELSVKGYQFHEGRPDFEPIEAATSALPQKKSNAKEGNE